MRTQVPRCDLSFILTLHNNDCLPELQRSSPKRLSSLRRLSPFCPRTQTACRIYTPHDLCVASPFHFTFWIVCLCFVHFPQSVNLVYTRGLFVLIINILLCIHTYIWLVRFVFHSFFKGSGASCTKHLRFDP